MKFVNDGFIYEGPPVSKSKKPALPLGPLADLMTWWRRSKVRGMIIGGLAVALLGRPRVTRDVDAVILLDESRWAEFLDKGEQFSFFPRLPDILEFAKQNRVLLLVHENSGVEVDISLGGILFEEEAINRANKTKVGKINLPVSTPEDLIVMKAIAHREKDLFDIEGLFDVYPNLDLKHIRKWVDELAQVLEMPELYEDLDRLIVKRRGAGIKAKKMKPK